MPTDTENLVEDSLAKVLGDQVQSCMPCLTLRQACLVIIKAFAGFHTVFGSRASLILLRELTESVSVTPVRADKKASGIVTVAEPPGEH
jgi:hypothetical protein